MKKVLFWLALGLLILFAAIPLVRFYLRVNYGFGLDPRSVVQQCMGGAIPRQSITFAKQTSLGIDPTFIAIISADGVTNWPSLFYNLKPKAVHTGPDGRRKGEEAEDMRAVVASRFVDYAAFPDTNALQGFASVGGFLKDHPYILSALVSRTNAFIILERY